MIPVVEEERAVGKRPVLEQVILHEEKMTIERHPADQAITGTTTATGTTDTTKL